MGGSATGGIETAGDRDWFAVELEAGTTYRFDLDGSPSGDGSLHDPYLRGIYDAAGALIDGTSMTTTGQPRDVQADLVLVSVDSSREEPFGALELPVAMARSRAAW